MDRFSRLSLNVKLPLLIAGLLVAVMGVFSALAYRAASRGALEAASARLETVAAQFAGLLSQNVDPTVTLMRTMAADTAIAAYLAGDSGSEAGALRVIAPLARDTSPGAATEIRGESGNALLTARPSSPLDSALAQAAPRRPDSAGVGPFFMHAGSVYYEVTAPIRGRTHPPAWLVIRRHLDATDGGLGRLAQIIGTDAKLLMGNRNGTVWMDIGAAPGLVPAVMEDGSYARAGARRMGSRAELAGTPWALAAELPADAVLRDAHRLARDVGLVALAILTVGTGLGWVVSRRLTGPISGLAAEAEAVARGDSARSAPAAGGDEIGRLSDAFRTMVGRVDESQARVRASEAQYRLLFDLNPNPMWVFDRSTLEFLAVNEAALQKYGYARDEFLAMTLREIRPAEDVPALLQSVAAGPRPGYGHSTWRHLTRDGKVLTVEVTGQPLRFAGREAELVLAQDVTERRALEDQLRQSQKMEAIGRLAGGIAHDFNNILTVIQTASEFLLTDLDAANPSRTDAADIHGAAERATSLTRQLLAFSRQQVFELRVLELNEVIRPLQPMLHRLVEANIEIVTRLARDLGRIEADTTQIEQVILNLVLNARDAIAGSGTILIETSNVMLDEAYPGTHMVGHPGRHVLLTVTDDGAGMDAETQTRIFEPFFTTKSLGQGTGLGLSTVYGIVKQLGGHIWVYSEVGRGTTFKVYFREHEGAASGVEAPRRAVRRDGRAGRAGTTILLVEDDAPVRNAIRRSLERHGYRVVEAEDGPDTLAMLSEPANRVDLVISDVVMPGMSGIELRQALQKLDASIPMLLMSGYSEEAITRLANREQLGPLIEKPFTVDRLLHRIEQVLGSGIPDP